MNGWTMGWLLALTGSTVMAGIYDAGSHAQLFVDRALVAGDENIVYTLHPATKHPANPVFSQGAKSVLFDPADGLFKAWFRPAANRFGLAVSRDGLHWEIDPEVAWRGIKEVVVFRNETDPDPERRFKVLWHRNDVRVNAGWSPDGRTFKPVLPAGREESIHPGAGDSHSGYYDRQRGLYVAFLKTSMTIRGFSRRSFSIVTSPDYATWSEPLLVFAADELDDAGAAARAGRAIPILDQPIDPERLRTEIYGVGVYQHESCVIGFPWIFTVTSHFERGNQNGPGEVQLAVTRDLKTWERPFREPVIAPGEPGAWDGGFLISTVEALRVGDEIWLYYIGRNYGHAHGRRAEGAAPDHAFGLGLATWPLDRFVSADGPPEGGTLTTIPFVFEGGRLELNAATAPAGAVTVALLDTAGAVLAESRPFTGDALRADVVWSGNPDLAAWAGTPVALRFLLHDAQLFSFAFRPVSAP